MPYAKAEKSVTVKVGAVTPSPPPSPITVLVVGGILFVAMISFLKK